MAGQGEHDKSSGPATHPNQQDWQWGMGATGVRAPGLAQGMRTTMAAPLTQHSHRIKGEGAGLAIEHPQGLQRGEGCMAYKLLPMAGRQRIDNNIN